MSTLSVPGSRGSVSAPPAPIQLPRPHPKPRPTGRPPAAVQPLEAHLVADTTEYTDVSLQSASHSIVLYTLRVWVDGRAEHIPTNQDCPGAAYRGTCHHLRDAVLVAAAYTAYLTLVAQEAEYRALPRAYDRATIERDRLAFVAAWEAVQARGYRLIRPQAEAVAQ